MQRREGAARRASMPAVRENDPGRGPCRTQALAQANGTAGRWMYATAGSKKERATHRTPHKETARTPTFHPPTQHPPRGRRRVWRS